MADISLKEYLEKVERLFQTGKYDEVVQHGQHILKHYPMNTPATRLLGRALVYTSEPQKAEMYLRRVLAVYPDDPVAHATLSDVNERLNKPNEAIWHMERALEQAPGVKAYAEKLRSLYQEHRNVDDPRLQLTTGAVARQYIRNGLYPQAIETLQATLDKAPKRVDLRLHLAQTLWEAGMQVEAAEEALDILDILPYCLGANNLLTRLWLGEGRPSDAQRYLNQIQEVEPYVALRLAQDATPDNNAFILPELDYRRVAESQLATNQPDWLSQVSSEDMSTELEADSIDEMELPTDLGEEDNLLPSQTTDAGHTGLLTALEADDSNEAEALSDDDMPDWLAEAAPIDSTDGDQVVDELNWLESGNDNAITDLFADFDDLDTESADSTDGALAWLEDDNAETNEAAALDWMAETELGDSSELPDLFGENDTEANDQPAADLFAETGDDPLAWMQDAGVELSDEVEPSMNFAADLEEDIEFTDPDNMDPLAWMQDAGVELAETHATPDFFADVDASDEGDLQGTDETLAWMQDDGTEVADELPSPESPVESDDELSWMQSPQADSSETGDDDSLEWLHTSDLVEPDAVSEVAGPLPEASAESDSLDWLSDDSMLDEFFDLEALSNDSPAPVADAPPGQAHDIEGWQDTMADEKLPPASDSGDSDEDLSSFEWLDNSTESDDETPDWLSENLEESEESEAADLSADAPEWLSEADDNNELTWLDEADPESSIETMVPAAEPAVDMPDWLSEAAPAADLSEDEIAEPAADSLDWLPDSDDANDEPAAEPATDMPDWLSEAAPAADLSEDEIAEPADDSFDWLPDSEDADDEPAAEPAADMPDWLSEAAPTADMGEDEIAEPVADSFDWLPDSDNADDEPAADMPDWLSESAPAADLSEDEIAQPAAEPAAEPAVDMPDWLSEAAPPADMGETDAEPVADSFDWLPDSDDADDEPAAEPAADMPDWLSEAAPTADMGEDEIAESAADSFDWLPDSDDADDEPAAEPATDMPDWLSEAAPTADMGEDEIAEPVSEVSEESLDWLPDTDDAAAEPAVDMPDWLSEAAPTTDVGEELAEPVSEVSEEALDWLPDSDDADDEPAAEPATDMPDWLSEAAPTADMGEDEIAEPVAELEDHDSDEVVVESIDVPDWLSEVVPATETSDGDSVEDMDRVEDDERFEWPEENAQAAANEVPDWLSEVESISDNDEVEQESQPVVDAPDGLSETEGIETETGDDIETVVGVPDWLSEDEAEILEEQVDLAYQAEIHDDTRDEAVEEPAEIAGDTRILSDNFDWEEQAEPEYETDSTESEFGWVDESAEESFTEQVDTVINDDLELEQTLAGAPAPPPADNAPDWLNAMVPGLDLDYDAQEDDEPVESAYLEAPVARREQPEVGDVPQDINWLTDIVDEETTPFEPITDVPATTSRRFVFTRKPAWLRMLTERLSKVDNEDDDFELPEWLQ